MQIKTFKDLIVWQEGHKLVIEIYNVTKKFPKDELFGLTSQMRRCVVSVTSNIAEGFGRRTYKDRMQFYYISQGSLTELKNQLLIAKDIGYIKIEDYDKLEIQANQTHRVLQGLLIKTNKFIKS